MKKPFYKTHLVKCVEDFGTMLFRFSVWEERDSEDNLVYVIYQDDYSVEREEFWNCTPVFSFPICGDAVKKAKSEAATFVAATLYDVVRER